MGIIIPLPHRHCAAPAKLKRAGSARVFLLSRARSKIRNLSAGMRPRPLQLHTAASVTPVSDATAALPPRWSMRSSIDVIITPYSSRSVNMSILHASAVDLAVGARNNWPMPPTAKTLGQRLRKTREALGVRAADLCRAIDCEPNRWSQYENGTRAITMPMAIRLCEAYGLTLDWIYRGDPAGLPVRLHQKLSVSAA